MPVCSVLSREHLSHSISGMSVVECAPRKGTCPKSTGTKEDEVCCSNSHCWLHCALVRHLTDFQATRTGEEPSWGQELNLQCRKILSERTNFLSQTPDHPSLKGNTANSTGCWEMFMSLELSFVSSVRELSSSGAPEISDHSIHFAIPSGLSNFKSLLTAICCTIKQLIRSSASDVWSPFAYNRITVMGQIFRVSTSLEIQILLKSLSLEKPFLTL